MKEARKLEKFGDVSGKTTRIEIKKQFKAGKRISGPDSGPIVSVMIREAERSLAQIISHRQTVEERLFGTQVHISADNWIKNSDSTDQRGRVGVKFPWQKKS